MRRVKSRETRDKSHQKRRAERQEARGERRDSGGFLLALDSRLSTLGPRRGATLSEILISLMVMSIGVVSLATLFPISVLRSIQATQLTNSTIHRLNAEELIHLFPRLLLNPDNDNLTTGGGTYLTEHQAFGVREDLLSTVDNPYNKGARYIVDPLGWNAAVFNTPFSNAAGRNVRDEFGNVNGASIDGSGDTVLRRYHGGFSPSACYLPDTWQLQAKGMTPTLNAVNHTITPVSGVDTATAASTLASLGVGSVRLVLFSSDGKSSVVRKVTNIASGVISWDDAITAMDDLPATGYGVISRFRLEAYDPRYSWLLTVRKTVIDGNANGSGWVDVVVFHKRAFSAANEQIYAANLVAQGTFFTITAPRGPGLPKPFVKKGGFVFDAQHAHWYRVTQVVERSDASNNYYDTTIDRPSTEATTRVMAMPGVVEVYPIGLVSVDVNSNPP